MPSRLPRAVLALASALALPLAATAHPPQPLGHPLGLVELDWDGPPEIARVLSANFDFHAGAPLLSHSPPARVERRGDRDCLVGAHLLLDVDDAFLHDIDQTVMLDLTFDRRETEGFVVSYDHALAPKAETVRFAADSAGHRWLTRTVRLARARFANRKLEGTDIAIAGLGSQLGAPADADREVVLCNIRVSRAAGEAALAAAEGKLSLTVRDAAGRPVAARAGLYRADGWAPLAGPAALAVDRHGDRVRDLPMLDRPRRWPEAGRYAFYVDGAYEAAVPAGTYELAVMKGPEHRIARRRVVVAPGKPARAAVVLERWRDLPAAGWYSGDAHVHLARPAPAANGPALALMRAEDVHVANMLEMGNLAGTAFPQYGFGVSGQARAGDTMLVPGQESPRTAHRGHSIGLNTEAFHWFGEEYFLYDRVADAVHLDGGLWGYAHLSTGAFNVERGLALDVALGKVDFLEILQFGRMAPRRLYDFLNLGFPLVPTAGSDFPYLGLPGRERTYVQVQRPAALPQAWFDGLATGRAFVTNGPVIELAVAGDTAGRHYHVEPGETLEVTARVAVNPDFATLEQVELIGHGKVLAAAEAAGATERLVLSHTLAPAASLWLAVRVAGSHGALAHSAPVFLHVGGDPDFSAKDEAAALARAYRDVLRAFRDAEPSLDEAWERASVEGLVLARWRAAKPALDARIERALAVYEALIEAAAAAGRAPPAPVAP